MKRRSAWLFVVSMLAVGTLGLGCDNITQAIEEEVGNESSSITCYSGGSRIFSGRSNRKLLRSVSEHGFIITDEADGKRKELSGDCVVVYD